MEILFRGIAKKTGKTVIGYHLKMLNEHGEMVDKIYKNCGFGKEEWGFMEIEPGSLEVFVEGKTLLKSLQEIDELMEKQKPRIPKFVHMMGEYNARFKCPVCEHSFIYDCTNTEPFFCKKCGQALRMENEDNGT